MKHGVHQVSVLGPVLFSIYVSPLGHIVCSYEINFRYYTDDNVGACKGR